MPTSSNVSAYKDVINTRTKSKASIMEDSDWYSGRLAPIVGGVSGKISPATGYAAADGLTVQEQGTVSNVMPFTGGDISDDISRFDLYLREARFVNRLTMGAVKLIGRIRSYDPDVLAASMGRPVGRTNQDRVHHAVVYSKDYRSSLYSLMRDLLQRRIILRSDANYLKIALLEGMHVYIELFRLRFGTTFTSDLTSLDMAQILQNLDGVIQYFTHRMDPRLDMDRFSVVHELRSIEKLVLQAKTDIIDYL